MKFLKEHTKNVNSWVFLKMLERLIKKATLIDVPIVLISAIAIVSIWRGAWNLMDIYLLPENFLYSQIASIMFGILILLIISWYK